MNKEEIIHFRDLLDNEVVIIVSSSKQKGFTAFYEDDPKLVAQGETPGIAKKS